MSRMMGDVVIIFWSYSNFRHVPTLLFRLLFSNQINHLKQAYQTAVHEDIVTE